MSRFSGKQGKGAMRLYREVLREEAEERQKNVKPENTKRYRLEQEKERKSAAFAQAHLYADILRDKSDQALVDLLSDEGGHS